MQLNSSMDKAPTADEVFRYAAIQNLAVNINGGSDKAQFALMGNYLKQDGILFNTDFEI